MSSVARGTSVTEVCREGDCGGVGDGCGPGALPGICGVWMASGVGVKLMGSAANAASEPLPAVRLDTRHEEAVRDRVPMGLPPDRDGEYAHAYSFERMGGGESGVASSATAGMLQPSSSGVCGICGAAGVCGAAWIPTGAYVGDPGPR